MSESLVQTLFDDPLDIVGDVHGEMGPLVALMRHLGYDDNGTHPDGRRLVFVGDLTDRGPDSPAVVDLVQRLIGMGRAQCVLGNHDLNILLDHAKPENRWFYGREFFDKQGHVVPQELADESTRRRVTSLFRTLPLALERDDVRVVHACWDDAMIRLAREAGDVVRLYQHHCLQIELMVVGRTLDDVDKGLLFQNRNPVKRLSSGPEKRTDHPIEAGGKMRREQRVRWWTEYHDTFCIFGHYSISDGQPRGNGSSFCVDYGVGRRWTERRAGRTDGFSFRLAAVRLPEMQIVFDDGERRSLGPECK